MEIGELGLGGSGEHGLRQPSPKHWIAGVLKDFSSFLQDHASCERKAAAFCMSMIAKHHDKSALVEALTALAREELAHFQDVFKLMQQRQVPLQVDAKDWYINEIIRSLRTGSSEHLLDRILASGVIEARGCERFNLLASALNDSELRRFYRRLSISEAGHYRVFIRLAYHYYPEDEVNEALDRILDLESNVMERSPQRAALH